MNSEPEPNFFPVATTLNAGGRLIDLRTPRIMGILNITPDSFYDGGRYQNEREALLHCEQMLKNGATFIDVGAYSSRPGADDIPLAQELERALAIVPRIARQFPEAVISIDTFRSEVARACVEAGAHIVNDISGGMLDPHMPEVVAALRVPYIIMHMRGTPQTMKTLTQYDDLLKEIIDFFQSRVRYCTALGVSDIIIDPGFGFAKNVAQNFALLNHLDLLRVIGRPVMAGLSRKSMIWKTLRQTSADALNGTTALNMVALMKGVSILRVHDVAEAAEVIALAAAMQEATKAVD